MRSGREILVLIDGVKVLERVEDTLSDVLVKIHTSCLYRSRPGESKDLVVFPF